MNQGKGIIFIAIVIIPLLFGGFVLTSSFDHGRWSRDAEYDDIGYFLRAYYRAEAIRAEGIVGGLKSYWEDPSHSPYANLVATAGFLVFGYHNWAPLIANFVLLIGVAAIAFFHFPWRHRWQGLLAVLGILLTPTMYKAVEQFRPDFAFGWVLALSSSLIYRSLAESSRRLWLATAFATAGAFLVKTSTLPLTIVVIGASTFFGLLRGGWNPRKPLRTLPKFGVPLIKIFGLALLVMLPHYIRSAVNIFRYIQLVVFDPEESAIWSIDLDLVDRIGAYLWGPWAWRIALPHLWLALGCIAVGTILAFLAKNRTQQGRMIHWCLMILISYAVVTINGEKTAFLGLPFFIMSLAAALESAAFLTQHTFKQQGAVIVKNGALVTFLASCLLLFTPTKNAFHWHERSEPHSMIRSEANRELILSTGALEAKKKFWRPPRVYFAANETMEARQIEWISLLENLPVDSFCNTRLKTLEDQIPLINAADYTVAAPASSLMREPRFPTDFTHDEVMEYLRSSDQFQEAASFEPLPGVVYYLFENTWANYPAATMEPGPGFSPMETDGEEFWFWTDKSATMWVTNPYDEPITVGWRAKITLGDLDARLTISTDKNPEKSTEYRHITGEQFIEPTVALQLEEKETVGIQLTYHGTPLRSPVESRDLCVRVHNCWLGYESYFSPDSLDLSLSQIAHELGKTRNR
ncbi:MAG: hypothetical protein CMO55_27635 [Verrucomicrobiales bacterium]|nr:hypothetical protein [Verrucomicrobiales bacterium]